MDDLRAGTSPPPLGPAFTLADDGGAAAPDWLVTSWSEPDWFYQGLYDRLARAEAAPLKSALGDRYDLYHDLVARHVGRGREALVWHDPARGSRSASFDDLDARCRARALAWQARGVGPESVLGVVSPLDLECVVALLTGLRLGACVSLLPPLGERWLRRRLDALAPTHIASQPRYAGLLGEHAGVMLDDRTPPALPAVSAAGRSYGYAPDQPCALLYSPLRAPLDQPAPVTSAALYHGALCDGLVTLSLGPGVRVAAPGFHGLKNQPSLLFSALLAGAAYVEVPVSEIERDPARFAALSMRSVGVCNRVRDLLLAARVDLGSSWQHWFRDPEEPLDWARWSDFITTCGLTETPASNAVVEAARGGSLLTSRKRRGQAYLGALMNVWPAPGRPWKLLDVNGSGQEAVGEAGVLAPADDALPPAHMVVAEVHPGEHLYAGPLDARRAGRLYPTDEVLAALDDPEAFRFATEVSLVPVLAGGRAAHHRFVLLVFTGAEDPALARAREAERARVAERLIEDRVGAEFVPDRIDFFARFARRSPDGAVDHAWCRAQFLSGALYRTTHDPASRALTALRGAHRSDLAAADSGPGPARG